MKLEFDLDAVETDQLRRLARQWLEENGARMEADDSLTFHLNEAIKSFPAEQADVMRKLIDEWTAVQDHITNQSNAEVRRILGAISSVKQ